MILKWYDNNTQVLRLNVLDIDDAQVTASSIVYEVQDAEGAVVISETAVTHVADEEDYNYEAFVDSTDLELEQKYTLIVTVTRAGKPNVATRQLLAKTYKGE